MAGLPGIDEALGARARAGASARGRDVPSPRGGTRARRATRTPCRPAAVRQLGDGRLRRARGGHPGRAARRRSLGGRPARVQRALGAGEAIVISTGAVVPEGRGRGRAGRAHVTSDGAVDVERVAKGDNMRAARRRRAQRDVVVRRGQRLGPAQVGALAAAGAAEVHCGGDRASPCSRRAPSCARRARRSRRARSTSRTTRAARATRVGWRGGDRARRRWPTTRRRLAPRSARARGRRARHLRRRLGRARTTSCARRSPSSARRRCSGASRCGRASRSPSRRAARRSSSGCRGIPSRRSSGSSSSSARRCSRCRARASRARPICPAASGRALRRNEDRDELVRARTRVDDDGVVLEPLAGQESHMIVRAAAADALVLVPRGERRAAGRGAGHVPRSLESGTA